MGGSRKAELLALDAHVHKTTYGPLIDMALCGMLLMWENQLLGKVGGGWALEVSTKSHSPNDSMPFYMAQKSLDFQGPTHSHLPCDGIDWPHQKHYIEEEEILLQCSLPQLPF